MDNGTELRGHPLIDALISEIDKEIPTAVEYRHRAHAEPEVSGSESATAVRLAAALAEGTGIQVEAVAETGFVARISATGSSGSASLTSDPSIAVRTELDALPIREETGVSWASTNGNMHACGHDVHQAAMLAFARAASRVKLPVSITLIAQPREEAYPSGAYDVVKAGVFQQQQIAAAIAVHVHPGIETGAISTGSGPINAAADEFEVLVIGRGGHGAYPHEACDPVPLAARITLALYELLRTTVNPMHAATLTVGELHAGSAANVIPDEAAIRGTLRTMYPEDRQAMHAGISRIATHIAAAAGADARVTITGGEPVLSNNADLVRRADPWLKSSGFRVVEPMRSCGADDFSYFSEEVPAVMSFLGVGPAADSLRQGLRSDETVPMLHSHRFLPPDSSIRQATIALVALYAGAVEMIEEPYGR